MSFPTERARPATNLVLAAVALLLLAASPAYAFRCGSRLVSEGDHYTKVLKFCGEPIGIQERVIYREGLTRPRVLVDGPNGIRIEQEVLRYQRSYVEILVEEWTYNFGPHRLMRLVRFENGFVADIDQLGYGFRE
ncbi:MAG: DUF2845 domain-containing protein [Gammaproteobacteria bacterium]|nr:DUF2845 domain-containing protein [Gammaproteobacteria bacterium]